MKTALGIILTTYIIGLLALSLYLAQCGNALTRSYSTEQKFGPLPKFSEIKNTKEKKKAFFSYFDTIIEDENKRILNDRKQIQALHQRWQEKGALRNKQRKQLTRLVKRYKIKEDASMTEKFDTLLRRAYPVPNALALAQAANESAWGTSRFARQGNNFFGQWCFSKGCGLVPSQRGAGAAHEVRVFDTPADSVRAYIRNINTHTAYKPLRELREQIVTEGETPTGAALAAGLSKYSERGHEYIDEIRAMIRINDLE